MSGPKNGIRDPLDPANAVKLLGVLPLFKIAKLYRVSYECLASRRESLGIEPAPMRNVVITRKLIQTLGVYPDSIVAQSFAVPRATITKLRTRLDISMERNAGSRTADSHDALKTGSTVALRDFNLGTETDRIVGKLFGLSRSTVHELRKRLEEAETSSCCQYVQRRWSSELDEAIGRVSDSVIADLHYVPEYWVTQRRLRFHIQRSLR